MSHKDIARIFEYKRMLKDHILKPSKFRGFEDEKNDIIRLFQRTVQDGDSNSALLIGPPGSGKSTLVQSVLEELSTDKLFSKRAVVVKLNGLIHTDDKLSLKAISKQMNLENVVEDRVTGNFAENMVLLLNTLKAKGQAKAIIFILEEVGLFCAHHNQTLLYNLFDIAHSNQASVCVLCTTSRFDVMESMEKRVKSRFSHRHIQLLPCTDAPSRDDRVALCNKLLQLDSKQVGSGQATQWNKHVASLLEPNSPVHKTLSSLFDIDSREQTTRHFLLQVVCCLDVDHQQLEAQDFTTVFEEMFADDKSRMLSGISVLELCLVVSMKHLVEIYQGEPINFEMVYNRYMKFTKQSSVMESPRQVVLKAFEHLQALEVLLPVTGGGGSNVQREYQLHHFQLTVQQVNEVVRSYDDLPEDLRHWADYNVL